MNAVLFKRKGIMDKKEELIEELNKLSKKCKESNDRRNNKSLFLNTLLNKLKKNIKYFLILSLISFLIKNFNIDETNYFQGKYFIDAFIIGFLSLLSNISLSFYIVSRDKEILNTYKELSKKISINLLLIVLCVVIYYFLRMGELI